MLRRWRWYLGGISFTTLGLGAMGLDFVEYMIAIEDAFDIAIPDSDVALLDTPGELVDYLCERLSTGPNGPPLVQTVFSRLRTALASELDVPRSAISPHTMLEDITDRPAKEVWGAVSSRLQVDAKLFTHAPAPKWLSKLRRAPSRSIGELARQLAMSRPAAMKRHTPGVPLPAPRAAGDATESRVGCRYHVPPDGARLCVSRRRAGLGEPAGLELAPVAHAHE